MQPKRVVTAQMLRDLISFHSSLPVDDQWQTAIWIILLEPFAEAEDIPPLLGRSFRTAKQQSSVPVCSPFTAPRRKSFTRWPPASRLLNIIVENRASTAPNASLAFILLP